MVRLCSLVALAAACLASAAWTAPTSAQTTGGFGGDSARGTFTPRVKTVVPERDGKTLTSKDRIDEWLSKEKARLDGQLKAAKRGTIDGRKPNGRRGYEQTAKYAFKNRADRDAEIKRIEDELEHPALPSIDVPAPKAGQVGSLTFAFTDYRIIQLVDNETAMVRATAHVLNGRKTFDWIFLLRGSLVNDLHEGQELKTLPGTFVVEEKQPVTSALGAAGMLHLVRPYDLAPHLKKLSAPPRSRP